MQFTGKASEEHQDYGSEWDDCSGCTLDDGHDKCITVKNFQNVPRNQFDSHSLLS